MKDRQTETERQRQRDRDGDRETETERQRRRHRDRETETETERQRQRRRQRDRDGDKETEIKRKMTPVFGLFHVPDLNCLSAVASSATRCAALRTVTLFNSARLVNSAKSCREHRPRHLNDDDDDDVG